MAAQPNLSRLNQRNLKSIIHKHTYPINYARPGRLILFNNQHFKSVKNYRAGREIDVENIRNTFQQFNFEIDVHLDKSGVETLQIIHKYAQRHDFTNDSCVIFFISLKVALVAYFDKPKNLHFNFENKKNSSLNLGPLVKLKIGILNKNFTSLLN
jgi:hypothetical protein